MITPQLQAIDKLDAQIETLIRSNLVWNERYRTLLLLGKALPAIDAKYKIEDQQVHGCESQLWLVIQDKSIYIDSNARIIRGLIVLILHCIDNSPNLTSAQQIFESIMQSADLSQHLAVSRNNGIKVLWQTIHATFASNKDD